MTLKNTQIHSPALLANKDRKRAAGRGTPSRRHNLFCLFLDTNNLMDLSFANLSSAVIHLQELTVHFSTVKADARQGTCPMGTDGFHTGSNERCIKLLPP